jgi:hypothetical protein
MSQPVCGIDSKVSQRVCGSESKSPWPESQKFAARHFLSSDSAAARCGGALWTQSALHRHCHGMICARCRGRCGRTNENRQRLRCRHRFALWRAAIQSA